MDFIRLNYLKFLKRLGLNIIGFGLLFALLDISTRSKTKPEDLAQGRLLGALVFLGFAVIFACIYFWAGYWYFRKGRKLLDCIIALALFDGSNYHIGIMYKTRSLAYTQYYLQAKVNGYPVVVHLNGSYGDRGTGSLLEFDFCIVKFRQQHKETLTFPLNWKGQPKGNMIADITAFVKKLKDKGYPACEDLLQMPE